MNIKIYLNEKKKTFEMCEATYPYIIYVSAIKAIVSNNVFYLAILLNSMYFRVPPRYKMSQLRRV